MFCDVCLPANCVKGQTLLIVDCSGPNPVTERFQQLHETIEMAITSLDICGVKLWIDYLLSGIHQVMYLCNVVDEFWLAE